MMRSRAGLCLLGLLCLHSSVFSQALEVPPGVLIFCDDPSVTMAVNSAVSKFNERLSTGHKLALFQILSASKSENGSDSVYSLQFTCRRSNCSAGSNTPWTECDYLPQGRKEPMSCNATVYMTENDAETRQVDCVLDDYIVAERASCMGCPEPINVNSEDLRVPVTMSLSKYNSMSDSTHLFTLNDIGHATRQVVAGFRFKLRFDMRKTICAKAEHKDLNELCVPDDQDKEYAYCNSTVDVAPWRLETPQTNIECEPGALPPSLFTRRRPPGWSPLRNFLFDRLPPTPTPTKAAESSEEDTTAPKQSTPPDVAAEAANDSPFHCPSKPWKAFNQQAPLTQAEDATPQPPEEGTFSDLDMLG